MKEWEPDRVAKFFADSGTAKTFAEADRLLDTFAVTVHVENAAMRYDQVLLYTFVNIAHRCFRGGIRVIGDTHAINQIRGIPGETVGDACRYLGASEKNQEFEETPIVAINATYSPSKNTVFYPVYGHWWAGVYRNAPVQKMPGGELGAVLAAGLTASALFTYFERNRAAHCVRPHYLSLWNDEARFGFAPLESDGPPVHFLPAELWLLGLGHLGQAYAWLLGVLPYPEQHDGRIVVQDDQRLQAENYATSVLFFRGQCDQFKTDTVKKWLGNCGFDVFRIERRLGPQFHRETEDPAICLAGLDRPEPRRWLEQAGFDMICDGGIGATARSSRAIRINTLPGPDPAIKLWPDIPAGNLPKGSAYEELSRIGVDNCGIAQVAGRAVAIPFVGSVVSTAVLAQILKPLHGHIPNCRWSYDLQSPGQCNVAGNHTIKKEVLSTIPFAESLPMPTTSLSLEHKVAN